MNPLRQNVWHDRRAFPQAAQKGRQQGRRRTLGGYVEDFDEPRTKHGKRCVSARRSWAGKKGDFFSILLCGEELFGIGGSKTTELSAVADAVQDRHLQALQRELLVPDLFECGDTEGESCLEFRGLRQPFLL